MSAQQDIVDQLELAVEKIKDAMQDVGAALKAAQDEGLLGEPEVYRIERGPVAHITMSLSRDHGFIDRTGDTLQGVIDQISNIGNQCPECFADLEEINEGQYGCPAGC